MSNDTLEQTGKIFSANLTRYRELAGLSLAELATRLGISEQLLKEWESGSAHPELPQLRLLREALGVDLETLLQPNQN